MDDHEPPDETELRLALLVLRCQAGDDAAFRRLYDEFGPRSLRYLRGLLGEAADDVQQEVWVTVYRRVATLADPRAFRTWLYRITRRRALDVLRATRRERELMEAAAAEATDVPEEMPTPEESSLGEDMIRMLDGLSPLHREVCLLRYQHAMSYHEIALVTSCSIGTVRSRLYYAKQHLAELIGERD